jgi:hypothetical protein
MGQSNFTAFLSAVDTTTHSPGWSGCWLSLQKLRISGIVSVIQKNVNCVCNTKKGQNKIGRFFNVTSK